MIVQAVNLASRFVRTGLHNSMTANCIYVICAFIDLEKGDERGDTLLVKLLVQPEPYMWAQLNEISATSGKKAAERAGKEEERVGQ
jgi:hypothetical protein